MYGGTIIILTILGVNIFYYLGDAADFTATIVDPIYKLFGYETSSTVKQTVKTSAKGANVAVDSTAKATKQSIDYVEDILGRAGIVDKQVLNLAGKTSLLGLAALINSSKFFIGLDSVASHIAASVNKESITLFGPSNPVNWKPWSDKAQIISQEDLQKIEVDDVMVLVDKIHLQ